MKVNKLNKAIQLFKEVIEKVPNNLEVHLNIGKAFLPAYLPLIEKRKSDSFSESDKEQQLKHRGLYAEYNLVYDRGTKFGLTTGHDADAVLMSLPPVAKWH